MTIGGRLVRGVVAGPLAALLVTLTVALPLLERADLPTDVAVESHHDPGHCPAPHDHTICTQIAANSAAPASAASPADASPVQSGPFEARVDMQRARRALHQAPARAPPPA